MRRAAFTLLVLAATFPAQAADIAGQASIIDGDTHEIHGQRIRLHGIDAPESAQLCNRDGKPWPCGRRAAFALADRIGNLTVTCEAKDRDRYGRIVAICFAGGENLNAWMVRQGWALAYRRYSRDYIADEDTARQARAGIWAGTFTPPWDWRRGERLP
jgi:endonuclease YncB( thermonuclease family)